jgi:hypothetical protein
MARFVKALASTSLVVVPMLIGEMTSSSWKWHALAGFALVVLLISWWFVFAPDVRFERVRKPTLDAALDQFFRTLKNKLNVHDRFQIRVNVMQPGGLVFRKELRIVYSYNMERSDADYGIAWPKGKGLCWRVFQTGCFGWLDKRMLDPTEFGLEDPEVEKTRHLWAILSLPIRRANRGKPVAVLNIDAISEEAADVLLKHQQSLLEHHNQPLIDLMNFVTLYYGGD